MKKLLSIVSLIVLSLIFSGITYAGQVNGTLPVSATVVGVCSVWTSAVNFGSVTGLEDVNANGDVTVNCPLDTTYNIALDAGLNMDQDQRRILNGTNWMNYALYQDAGLSQEWGDSDYANTYASGTSLADTGSGVPQAHTVYGHLVGFPGISADTVLTDTVTVTVYY